MRISPYMTKLRAFTMQAEAAGRWARHGESARPAAVRPGSVYPQDIRQRDSDFDLPRRKSRRAVSPRKSDALTVCVLSSATSSLPHRVHIYDGRPPILPASIQVPDLREDVHSSVEDSDSDSDSDSDADVTASAVPPRVFTPVSHSSSHHSVLRDSPVTMMCSEPVLMSMFSNDTDPDLADVQRKLQPLPAPVSTVSASRSLENFLAYDIMLLDSAADLPQLAVPLLPLPGDLQLLADAAHELLPASAHHSPSLEPSSSVVPPPPPPQDLSREGLFDPYCAAADTGDVPLIPAGLPG